MMAFFKRWLAPSRERISREQALQNALAECNRLGWPWRDPVMVQDRGDKLVVITNTSCVGGNASFIIDPVDGHIVKATLSAR